MNYKAVVKNEGEWWIGWIEEVPGVNCSVCGYKTKLETDMEINNKSLHGLKSIKYKNIETCITQKDDQFSL